MKTLTGARTRFPIFGGLGVRIRHFSCVPPGWPESPGPHQQTNREFNRPQNDRRGLMDPKMLTSNAGVHDIWAIRVHERDPSVIGKLEHTRTWGNSRRGRRSTAKGWTDDKRLVNMLPSAQAAPDPSWMSRVDSASDLAVCRSGPDDPSWHRSNKPISRYVTERIHPKITTIREPQCNVIPRIPCPRPADNRLDPSIRDGPCPRTRIRRSRGPAPRRNRSEPGCVEFE